MQSSKRSLEGLRKSAQLSVKHLLLISSSLSPTLQRQSWKRSSDHISNGYVTETKGVFFEGAQVPFDRGYVLNCWCHYFPIY